MRLTVQAPFNDVAAVEAAFRAHGPELACVIVEPVAGNMGCVPPVRGFLEELRELCDRHGALLIFDEVMTGFRVAWGGAQALYEIRPDLTCLGKVVGGGLPAAAYGGRRELMQRDRAVRARVPGRDALGQSARGGGRPRDAAPGSSAPGVYETLAETTRLLTEGLAERAVAAGVELTTAAVGGMFGFFFHPGPVRSFEDAKKSHGARFRALLRRDAGARRLPGAVGLRGGLRVARARPARDPSHAAGGRGGARGRRASRLSRARVD